MHPAFILLALLFFPAVEVYLLFRWLESDPVFASLWLACATLGGLYLVRRAKAGFREVVSQMRDGASLDAILKFGKLWLVGALLFFPGVISDALAILALLLPGRIFSAKKNQRRESPRIIEGEYEREDD